MIPAFLHQRLLQLVRWVIPLVLFFVALAVTVVWDKRNGTPVSGRSDEACSHLALARQGRLDAGRLQALLRESPAQYLLLWRLNFEGKGQNSLPLRRLHFPGDDVSILPPRLYAFRDSAGE